MWAGYRKDPAHPRPGPGSRAPGAGDVCAGCPECAPPRPALHKRPFVPPSPGTPVPEKFHEKNQREANTSLEPASLEKARTRATRPGRREVSLPRPRGEPAAPAEIAGVRPTLEQERWIFLSEAWDARPSSRARPGGGSGYPGGRRASLPTLLYRSGRSPPGTSLSQPGCRPHRPRWPPLGKDGGLRALSATSCARVHVRPQAFRAPLGAGQVGS